MQDGPPNFLRPPDSAEAKVFDLQRLRLLLALLALACAWQIFGLPGAPLQSYNPPRDRPWMGQGLRGVFISPDGSWTIHREGYLDRMNKYSIDPAGRLSREQDTGGLQPEGEDVSGVLAGGRANRIMRSTAIINVEPAPFYYRWQKLLYEGRITPEHSVEKVEAILLERDRLAREMLSEAAKKEAEARKKGRPYKKDDNLKLARNWLSEPARFEGGEPVLPVDKPERHVEFIGDEPDPLSRHVRLEYTYKKLDEQGRQQPLTEVRAILPGSCYYPVYDAAAYIEPDLWLSSDRGTKLHHLRVSDATGSLAVEHVASAEIPSASELTHGMYVVRDPQLSRIAAVMPDGERYWFELDSLKFSGADNLPGEWRMIAAAFTAPGQRYPLDLGLALPRTHHEALMQLLVIVFLASLLGLLHFWRQTWKFTVEATTADTN